MEIRKKKTVGDASDSGPVGIPGVYLQTPQKAKCRDARLLPKKLKGQQIVRPSENKTRRSTSMSYVIRIIIFFRLFGK
jgi:hypothetical protein